MKKSVLFFVLFLIGLLGGYYYMNSKKENTNQEVAQTDVQTTDEKVINVGVLQLLSHPALDSIYKGMVEELARQGYGRSLWLPTLLYQKTNRYAVVGIMLSSCIFVCVKRIVFHADLAYYIVSS